MEKILKKYKTIPDHLYVRRNADKQLKMIIEEMESPGYVLVARQMGKTNLLFHAKRTLENENRIFVYVDLSSLFEYERDCYQNIIDNIIEQHEEVFEEKELRIKEIRDQKLPPNKEYSRSLRALLKHFKGDIIIVLDEIDALRSVDYSDNIFAQIRSSYFNRTSFPEYSKLTYLLSGVIDPSDLIKDKNKSPFNIGEKIYLDDFTYEEYQDFISKSKLKISKEIMEEIFSWTNGNPRLTFDICSEIENIIIDEKLLTKKSLETLIEQKYLTDYDIPPVDHIRERVMSNSSIKNAVKLLQENKNNITDKVKRKLYLYGIIGALGSNNLTIKNRIIKQALSLDWIKQLSNIFDDGMLYYVNKNYKDAIVIFKEILNDKNDNFNENTIEDCNYYLGRSYHYLREFEDAIPFLTYDYKNEKYKRNAFSILGSCKLLLDFDSAIEIFEQVIDEKIDDWAHLNALLSMGINIMQKDEDKALNIFMDLEESTMRINNTDEKDLLQIRTLSLYYQYVLQRNRDSLEEAKEALENSLKYASVGDSLWLLYQLFQIKNDNKLKEELILKIIDTKIVFSKERIYPITFVETDLYQYIDLVFDDDELFKKIVNYSLQEIYKGEKSRVQLLYDVGYESKRNNTKYFEMIRNDLKEEKNLIYIRATRNLALHNVDDKYHFFKYFDEYFHLYENEIINIDSEDIYVFALAVKKKMDLQKYGEALTYCVKIEDIFAQLQDEELKYEEILFDYYQAQIYDNIKAKEKANIYATKVLNTINTSGKTTTSLLDEEGLKLIKDSMKKMSILRKPIIANKKYNRNQIIKVQYEDGTIVEKKYKKLEKDLAFKQCKIIESES